MKPSPCKTRIRSQRPARAVARRAVLLAVLLAAIVPMNTAFAQQRPAMSAVGDANNLWIIRISEDGSKFNLLHRKPTDLPESRLTPIQESIFGRIMPNGLAAGEGVLLIVYADGAVQTIRPVEDSAGRRGFSDLRLTALPSGVALRSLAITRSGPWALVRVEDPKVIQLLDHPESGSEEKKDNEKAPEKTEEIDTNKDGDAKAEPPAPAVTTPPAGERQVKVDRLLSLKGNQWVSVPMPEDWPKNAEGWLVNHQQGDVRPMLVVTTQSPLAIRTYTWTPGDDKKAGAWETFQRPIEQIISLPPIVASQQLVVARRTNSPGKLEVSFSVVRPEDIREIEKLSLPDPVGAWSIVAQGDRLLLIGESGDKLLMRRMDVTGQLIDPEPIPLQSQPAPLGPVADLFVFVAVLMLATPMLILMLRRDPSAPIVQLPASLRLGDLPLRALAAAIDLAPCLGAVMLIWNVTPMDLVDTWPGNSGGWEAMIPSLVLIGSFVGYSALSEVFFAKTIGKALMGLQVTGLKGEPPDIWQVLSRNGLKALDLIAPPLIIFAIISPSRQRLGDVVARTVVVTRVKPDDQDPNIRKDNRSEKAKPLDPRPNKPGKK